MLKILFSVSIVLASSLVFASGELPRGSKIFSACQYTSPTGGQASYQVDQTVGVVDSQLVKGCPIAITYELGATDAVVYTLGHVSVGLRHACMYGLKDVGTVDCTVK